MRKTNWFLSVFITALISFVIQSGLSKFGVINMSNIWADLVSWIVIFFVVFIGVEASFRTINKMKHRTE
ncbi:putative membrane protein [Bacillus sp. TE9122W]